MSQLLKTITAASVCVLLAACGGGGGGDGGNPPVQQSDSNTNTGNNNTGNNNNPGTNNPGTNNPGTNNPGNNGGNNGGEYTPDPEYQVDATARFNTPTEIAASTTGYLYVLDSGNQAIRKISSLGDVTTVHTDPAARKLTADYDGNVFVLSANTVYKIDNDGNRTTVEEYPTDIVNIHPIDIAADAQGRVYVLTQYRDEFRVTRFDKDNSQHTVFTFTNTGSAYGLACDWSGNLAVSVMGNFGGEGLTSVIRVPQTAQPATLTSDGVAVQSVALSPNSEITFDASGKLYVTDTTIRDGQAIPRIFLIAPDGTTTDLWHAYPDGSTAPRETILPIGFAVLQNGLIFASDPGIHAIYKLVPSQGQTTLIAGKAGEAGNSD